MHLVDTNWIDFAVGHIDPLFSLTRTCARVLRKRAEADDMMSVDLQVNRNWRGFRPGQYVPLRVTIGGVVHERCYSPTSDPAAAIVTLTVKRQPQGRVSGWIHDGLRVGDVVELGDAGGDFTLEEELPAKLLLVAGGSGITAVYSLLRGALALRPEADIVLLYAARSSGGFAFRAELEALAAQHPGCRVQLLVGERFDFAALPADSGERALYVCGPGGLMRAISEHAAAKNWEPPVQENFGLNGGTFVPLAGQSPASLPATPSDGEKAIRFSRSGLTHKSGATLLVAAEEAGLRPAYGCRMGICQTCTCTKKSGAVRDVVTGAVDDRPNQRIRLCVSQPLGDVDIDL